MGASTRHRHFAVRRADDHPRGDFEALGGIDFNKGDLMFAGALMIFCIYSALMPHRPNLHALAFLAFTSGVGALVNVPFAIWEGLSGYTI